MHKRLLSYVLAIALTLSILSIECLAAEDSSPINIRYLDDGSYIVTTIQEFDTRATQTKSGNKTESIYNNDGSLACRIILGGTFTYTGTTATCISSNITVNIYDSSYSKVSSSSSKSGNTASGSATISRKVLGVTVATNTYPLSLSCDKDGNLY